MPPDLVRDAARQLEICNACRYCEGYCAVFPALERRTAFAKGDVHYLANLCHDCRDCFYACPFAPPHEFGVNLPLVFAGIREQTYREYARPRALARLVGWGRLATLRIVLLGLVVAVFATLLVTRPDALTTAHTGPGAFYEVVPWLLMVVPALVGTAYILAAWTASGHAFWRDTGRGLSLAPAPLGRTFVDIAALRFMRGGGEGCDYPDERPRGWRWTFHMLVFYGFALDFASTCVAALEQDVLGVLPPYPLLSLPVVLGTVGGIAMIAGATGLVALKPRSDPVVTSDSMTDADYAFIAVLGLASLTGLATLALRGTALLGPVLIVHLGVLAALYVLAPYSKFVHFVYRALALARNRGEEAGEARETSRDARAHQPVGLAPDKEPS